MKNLINNNIGDSFASSMLNILKDDKHQKIFKKAETACNCKKDCDCSKDSCKCKNAGCSISCLSCGKERAVEAGSKIIEELLSVSAVFDHYGLEKQATSILNIANVYLKKLSKNDSNDVKMKDLDKSLTGDLADEIEELEKDPEYTQWANNPDLFAKDRKAKIPERFFTEEFQYDHMDPEVEKYILESEFDPEVFNADDEEPDTSTMRSPRKEWLEVEPDTERFIDIQEPRQFYLDEDQDLARLLEESEGFEPISEDFPEDIDLDTRDTLPPETMRSTYAEQERLLLVKSLNKIDKFFKKAKEESELEELDEDFEDEE